MCMLFGRHSLERPSLVPIWNQVRPEFAEASVWSNLDLVEAPSKLARQHLFRDLGCVAFYSSSLSFLFMA